MVASGIETIIRAYRERKNVFIRDIRYKFNILPEVTTYTSSESYIYNLEFRGSYSKYMPTALHATNMYDLVLDRYLQPYLDTSYIPPIYYDSEIGFYVGEYLYEYNFSTLDYKYSKSQLQNASAATGSEFDRYLTLSSDLGALEQSTIEKLAKEITKNATNDFEKVTRKKIITIILDTIKPIIPTRTW